MKTNLYVPSDEELMRETMDLSGVVDMLDVAAKQSPKRMGELKDPKDPTALVSFKGDNVCLEGLFHKPGVVAVCDAHLSPGSIMKNHFHKDVEECYEVVYCQCGHICIEVEVDGEYKKVDLKTGDIYTIPRGAPHSVECYKMAVLLCITIPADPDYPESDQITNGG